MCSQLSILLTTIDLLLDLKINYYFFLKHTYILINGSTKIQEKSNVQCKQKIKRQLSKNVTTIHLGFQLYIDQHL